MRLNIQVVLLLFLATTHSHIHRKNLCLSRHVETVILDITTDLAVDYDEHAKRIENQLHTVCGGHWGVIVLKTSSINSRIFYSISATEEESWIYNDDKSGLKYIIFGVDVTTE
uniref:Inhibitor I9 domain-containing protein n=1 Tax=Steinernema glaseri TaxID=37863 RepID=A0A1I8AAD9_9BILA